MFFLEGLHSFFSQTHKKGYPMIKKYVLPLICLILLLAVSVPAHAVDWSVVNEKTITWTKVTVTSGGDPLPVGDIIKFQVYIVKDGADKATAVKVGGQIGALEYTITFSDEGRWLVGVQSIRIPIASPTDIQEGVITWSDVVDVALVPVPFGFIFFEAPGQVGGLGPKS